jgi:hypothetical protein
LIVSTCFWIEAMSTEFFTTIFVNSVSWEVRFVIDFVSSASAVSEAVGFGVSDTTAFGFTALAALVVDTFCQSSPLRISLALASSSSWAISKRITS